MNKEYINIGNINQIGKYKDKITTDEVILTYERIEKHIIEYHKEEYYQLKNYI